MKHTSGNTSGHPLFLPLAAASNFFGMTVATVLGPLLVDMADEFHTTVAVTGQLATVTALPWALSAVSSGPFSDTYGRKPLLLLGIGLMMIGSLGAALAPSFAWIMIARLFTGMGGMVPPVTMTTLADTYPIERRGRVLGLVMGVGTLGPVLAVPLLALIASIFGWRSAFVILAGLLSIHFVALVLWFPRTSSTRATKLDFRRRILLPALLPQVRGLVAANLLVKSAYSVLTTYVAAYLIKSYGLTLAGVALPVALISLGATPAGILGGLVADRPGPLLRAGLIVLLGSGIALAMFTLTPVLWVSILLGILLNIALQLPSPLTLNMIMEGSKESRGTMTGVFGLSTQLGIVSGAAAGGLALGFVGFVGLGYMSLAVCLVSGFLYLSLQRRGARTAESSGIVHDGPSI